MIPELPRIQKSKDWHNQRMKGIGGSDWAAILSKHHPQEYKWSCLRKLFYTKRNVKPDFPENTSRAAMRGNILEPVVAELFKEHMGCTFTDSNPRSEELWPGQKVPDWWIGNPDYIAVMPGDGRFEGLECKTMNSHVWFDFLENGLPESYQIQPQHYIGLTGLDVFHVAVIWPDGIDFQTEPVPRNEEMLRLMIDAGKWFMEIVLQSEKAPKRPPILKERCGSCPYSKSCLGQAYFNAHELNLTDLSRDEKLYSLLSQMEHLKSEKRDADKHLKEIQALMEEHIITNHGDDIEHFFCQEFETKWVKTLGSRFQKNELLADDPSLAPKLREYTNYFPRRTFSPKITKKSISRWEGMSSVAV